MQILGPNGSVLRTWTPSTATPLEFDFTQAGTHLLRIQREAREGGAEYVDDLRDDDLPGEPGSAEHSLLGLLGFDYTTIVEALGGDASALQAVDTRNPVGDEAVYPQ